MNTLIVIESLTIVNLLNKVQFPFVKVFPPQMLSSSSEGAIVQAVPIAFAPVGKCTISNVCYRCKIVRGDNHKCESYVGQTSRNIKKRIGEHLGDARRYRPGKSEGSRLSHYIGDLFFNSIPHTLNWSILAQKPSYSPVGNFCMLCNVEKVLIMYHPEFSTLNLRNELYGWCPHKERFLLINS